MFYASVLTILLSLRTLPVQPMTATLADHGGTLVRSEYSSTYLYPLTDETGAATQCPGGMNGWCAQWFSIGLMAYWPVGSFTGRTWNAAYLDAEGHEVTISSTDFNGNIIASDVAGHYSLSASFSATDSLGRACSGGMTRVITRKAIYRGYTYVVGAGQTWLACE